MKKRAPVAVVVPVVLQSEQNLRESHWATHDRNKRQQSAVRWACFDAFRGLRPPFRVTFRRIVGPRGRALDDGNYHGAFKHVQDAVAKLLDVDDGDRSKVRWTYAEQVRGDAHGVEIVVRERVRLKPWAMQRWKGAKP